MCFCCVWWFLCLFTLFPEESIPCSAVSPLLQQASTMLASLAYASRRVLLNLCLTFLRIFLQFLKTSLFLYIQSSTSIVLLLRTNNALFSVGVRVSILCHLLSAVLSLQQPSFCLLPAYFIVVVDSAYTDMPYGPDGSVIFLRAHCACRLECPAFPLQRPPHVFAPHPISPSEYFVLKLFVRFSVSYCLPCIIPFSTK